MPQRVTSGTSESRAAQRRALLALASEPGAALTRPEYERLTGVSPSQAASDLAELVSAGMLVHVGTGRASRYELAPEAGRAVGAQRAPQRRRLLWAALVGVAALAAFGAAARSLPLVATHGFGLTTMLGLTTKTAAGPSGKPRSVHRSAGESVRPPHATPPLTAPPAAVAAKHAAGRAKTERVASRPIGSASHVQERAAQQPTYVSNVVTTTPVQTATASSGTSSAATPEASGPAPLRAPPAASPPQPLRAP